MMRGPVLSAAELRAANVNPATGLATDYLNHYNEVAMMIGMLADAPELIEPVLDWRPIGYAAHFQRVGVVDADVALAAYDGTSEEVRARFRVVRRQVELAVADVQDLIESSGGNVAEAAARAADIFSLIAGVGAVINGGEAVASAPSPPQAKTDARFS